MNKEFLTNGTPFSMGKSDLSSKIVLILATEFNLSLSLKNELQKEIGVVDVSSNLHQAVIHIILTEPDFVLIEVSPQNFSGLQLLEVLKKLKGIKKNPHFFVFAEKKTKEFFQRKAKHILFLDNQEPSTVLKQLKAVLEEVSLVESENIPPWVQYKERADAFPVYRKELDILEKLGQMGIIKKT